MGYLQKNYANAEVIYKDANEERRGQREGQRERQRVGIGTKTVSVDSWLAPEEFPVAFEDEDYDVIIVDA